MKTTPILIFLFFLCCSLSAFSQYRTEFAYDYAGNRISRKVIVLSNSPSMAPPASDVTSPLQEDFSACRITVYPNPTKGVVKVSLSNGNDDCPRRFDVYGPGGQQLFTENHTGNGEVTIDLSSRPEGVYILSIRSAEDEHQYKIIKQ